MTETEAEDGAKSDSEDLNTEDGVESGVDENPDAEDEQALENKSSTSIFVYIVLFAVTIGVAVFFRRPIISKVSLWLNLKPSRGAYQRLPISQK